MRVISWDNISRRLVSASSNSWSPLHIPSVTIKLAFKVRATRIRTNCLMSSTTSDNNDCSSIADIITDTGRQISTAQRRFMLGTGSIKTFWPSKKQTCIPGEYASLRRESRQFLYLVSWVRMSIGVGCRTLTLFAIQVVQNSDTILVFENQPDDNVNGIHRGHKRLECLFFWGFLDFLDQRVQKPGLTISICTWDNQASSVRWLPAWNPTKWSFPESSSSNQNAKPVILL